MKKNNSPSAVNEPIAIVGMSCSFPMAGDLKSFWNLLLTGKDTITEIPKERWDHSAYYDPDSSADRKSHQKHASLLDNIHHLDSFFFNISPAEAIEMSPSQKLMLELVWQAMEDSSIPFDSIKGSNAGVYIGNIWNDFEHHRKHKNAAVTTHSAVGQSSNVIANRVSFIYGFTGPSLVLDTGCSSSLVALHLACQSLLDGSIQMAFAGGVNHILDPDQNVLLSKFGGLSKKGKCSTFDAGADGFVRGEGAGILMLKKLSDAKRDGDKIHALIKGTGVNNNGFNVNLPATSTQAQIKVIEEAFSKSGIAPNEVHYVEAHGTGTKLGDPTETKALGQFFSKGRDKELRIGSVKTNIGHLEAAAGIAGLIKVVLAMRHRTLPPSLNYKTPNPDIPFEELKLRVQDKVTEWPAEPNETLKAGINSFGWGGTNAHTIIEEYQNNTIEDQQNIEATRYCLPISAKSPEALLEFVKSYKQQLLTSNEIAFREICVASSLLKPVFEHSVMFSGQEKNELLENIDTFLNDEQHSSENKKINPNEKIVFVFPGQGSQWLGMGKELIQTEPVFKKWIKKFDEAYRPYTDWVLLDEIQATEEHSRMNEINVIQPAICAVQVALAKLWMSWGIQPHAVIGHSMGEVAAAFISGALTIEEASCIICTRSNLMKKVSGNEGAMAMTELSVNEANNIIARYPELSLAVNNSPKSTVLSGDKKILTSVILELENKGLFGRMVKVDVASHSVYMDPIKEDLRKALASLRPISTSVPMYSTVRNKVIDGFELDDDYWVDNLRGTVHFAPLVQKMMNEEHTVFIEVSPHPVLTNAVNECAEHIQKEIISIPSIFRDKGEQKSIFKNFSELVSRGHRINWSSFYKTNKVPGVDLPPYPFQRERYELDDRSEDRIDQSKSSSKFPLLGHHMKLAGMQYLHYWETPVSLSLYPYLRDHQVNGTVVFPGAGYAEIILEAAGYIYGGGSPMIKNLSFIRSLNLLENETKTLQLRVAEQDKRKASFEFFLKETLQGEDQWIKVADGELHNYFGLFETEDSAKMQTYEGMDKSAYYSAITSLGIEYGECFQNIDTLQYKKDGHSNRLRFTLIPDNRIVETADKYLIHPALLDSCFQSVFFDVLKDGNNDTNRTTFLSDIDDIQFLGEVKFDGPLYGEARLYPMLIDKERGSMTVKADVLISNNDESKVLKIIGVKAKIIDTDLITSTQENLKNWVYSVQWNKRINQNKTITTSTSIPPQTWVLFGDVYGLSTILVDKMQEVGIEFIHINPGQLYKKHSNLEYTIDYKNPAEYQQLLQLLYSGSQKITGILHLGGIYYPSGETDLTTKDIESEQAYGSLSVIHLIQQLEKLKLLEIPQLVVVTNGTEDIENDSQPTQPIHAPLCGVVRVAANELTQYRVKRYDLSFHPMLDELDQLLKNLNAPDSSDREVALRGKDEYTPQLTTSTEITDQSDSSLCFSDDGTYLVTGFRGLAFEFIEWMISQGARNFALISRSGKADNRVMESIENYKSKGCEFTIIRTDITNYEAVENALNVIEKTMPQLRGVVHAAGVIEAKVLTEISEQGFLDTLSPKMKGAWNLHLLTKNMSLDCFILFSSASSLIGLTGQASYVAANTFLDVLAHSRKKRGLPAQSINWGVIKDVGMVANDSELEKYAEAEGFEAVTAKDALSIYDKVHVDESAQLGILQLNVSKMETYYSDLASTTYFKSLLKSNEHDKSEKNEDFLSLYKDLDSIETKQEALKELVINLAARIIKSPASKINSSMTFKGLGIDSLMAIQLRNLIERGLQLKLSVALFWTYPSIREYTVFLLNQLQEHALEDPIEKSTNSLGPKPETDLFFVSSPNPSALQRILCFHDAGGSASLYDNWAEHLGNQFELVVIELPGRGKNFEKQSYKDIPHLIEDLTAVIITKYLDKPFVFFGHSMGGLLAFELAKSLRKINKSLPKKMFISSTPQLSSYDKGQIDPKLSNDELMDLFPYLKEMNSTDKEGLDILLNILRDDLELLSSYKYMEDEPLATPIITIRGTDDLRVRHEQMEAWSKETSESFRLISRSGGHRYVANDSEYITSLIRNELTESLFESN